MVEKVAGHIHSCTYPHQFRIGNAKRVCLNRQVDTYNKFEILKRNVECLVLLDAHERHHGISFELLPLIMILLKISKPMLEVLLPISIQLKELPFEYLKILFENL